jgi:hypothetical protein
MNRPFIVKRDFAGGVDYRYTAGWFATRDEAYDFTTRLTGGGSWILVKLGGLADVLEGTEPAETILFSGLAPDASYRDHYAHELRKIAAAGLPVTAGARELARNRAKGEYALQLERQ